MVHGVLFVMTTGIMLMPVWSVDNWDILLMVNCFYVDILLYMCYIYHGLKVYMEYINLPMRTFVIDIAQR